MPPDEPLRPTIVIPPFARRPSGLWLPTGRADTSGQLTAARFVAGESGGGFTVVERRSPDPMEAMYTATFDEEDFGLSRTSLDELRVLMSAVDFATAVDNLGRLAVRSRAVATTASGQTPLVHDVYDQGAPVIAAIERQLRQHTRAAFFTEQQLLILMRLVIEHAGDSTSLGDAEATRVNLQRGLLAAHSVARDSIRELEEPDNRDKWLGVFIQNAAFNATNTPLPALARPQIWLDLSEDPAVGSIENRVPVTEWLAEDIGLSRNEQLRVGFWLLAKSGALELKDPADWSLGVIDHSALASMVQDLGLGNKAARVVSAVSAPRSWYIGQFAQGPGDASDVSWRRAPFEQKPLIDLGDGHFVVASPRSVLSWATSGFQHRVFAAAEKRGESSKQQWMRYIGEILEEYAVRLTQSVYPSSPATGDRVKREVGYGRNGSKKTSDIAIDLGHDLVLVEVGAGRLTQRTLIRAEWDAVAADLKKLVLVRLKKLDHSARAILDGQAKLSGLDADRIHTVWPVVVTADAATRSNLLWQYVEENAQGLLKGPRLGPVTLLSLEEFEILLALAEQGHNMARLLEAFNQSDFHQMDFEQWLANAPEAPDASLSRPRMLERKAAEMFEDLAGAFGIDWRSRDDSNT